MTIATITPERYTILDFQEQYNFSLSWVRGHPAGAPYRQSYEDFQTHITKNLSLENELQQKSNELFVKVALIDRELNGLATQVVALLPLQKDQDPATLQEHLLENLPLSRFVRPTLGNQLKTMKGWVSILKASSHSELQKLSGIIEEKTTVASKLEEEFVAAEKALDDFLKIGARAKLFADFNVLRNVIYKGVGTEQPQLAEEFFLHETTRATTLEKSLKDSQQRLDRLQAALEAEKERLAELQAKKSEREEEEAQRKEAKEKLAQIKQQKAALKQQEELLKAQTKKKKKK